MGTLLQMLDTGDPWSLLCLSGILAFVGGKMTDHDPAARQWGWRVGAGAFVAYAVYAAIGLQPADAQDWLQIAFRGLLAAGLGLTVSWVLLSVAAFVARSVAGFARAQATSLKTGVDRREANRLYLHEQATRREAEQEAERRARESRETRAEATRRRDDARLRCLMLYDRHHAALSSRFPRERLQEYLAQYCADSSAPEIVEERAQTLIAMIDDWVKEDSSRQRKEFQSLEELAAFFKRQRDEVARLSYDVDEKDSFLTNLNIQEEQAIRRFLSS